MPAIVTGWASTPKIDADHQKVASGSLLGTSLPAKHIPLLYRHGDHEIKDAIGTIAKLEYRDFNKQRSLWAETIVTNPRVIDAIKRKVVTGFSVRLGIMEKAKYTDYVQIIKAAIVEISLVCDPANSDCKIVSVKEHEDRFEPVQQAISRQFDHLIQAIQSVRRCTTELSKALKQ